MLLHAEDDKFVPFSHSKQLIQICDKHRPKEYPPVKFVGFDKRHGLGHNSIYTHNEIYPIIK